MQNPDIRELTPEDLEGALALSTTAGWNQRIEDWRMMHALAPHGTFAAYIDGRVIGTAIGIDYGGFGWIAMMLVDPACRGRGVGRRLLEVSMKALPDDRPIRLDATPLGRPLYESCGFEEEARLTRLVAPPRADGHSSAAPPDEAAAVRPLVAADIGRVADCDAGVFGGNRRAVLEWTLGMAPGSAWILDDSSGIPRYRFGRPGRVFDQIGPVAVRDERAARALVTSARRHTGSRALTIDVFDRCADFAGWLRTSGFDAQRPLFRMSLAGRVRPAPVRPVPVSEVAILGPEFG